MHVEQALGPVTKILDELSSQDELIFANGSIDTLKDEIGDIVSLQEINISQSSFSKRIFIASKEDGTSVLIFADLPGEVYSWHWQAMIKGYLDSRGVDIKVKKVKTEITSPASYTRVVKFFDAYAEYLRDVQSIVIAPPRIFSEDWGAYFIKSIDDDTIGVRGTFIVCLMGKK